MPTLAERLKRLRKEKRWTLNDVAKKLGLRGHSTYSNWEYGRTEPDAEMTKRLADLYGVSTDFLLGSNPVTSSDVTLLVLRDLAEKYHLDLSNEAERQKLEDIIRIVANDYKNKK